MSRYNVVANNKTYTYGYDACVPEYFLMSVTPKGRRKFLVGGMSALMGTGGNLLQELKRNKLLGIVNPDHITLAACDLPIPPETPEVKNKT